MNKKILFYVLVVAFSIPMNAQFGYSETNNLFYHTLRTPQSNIDNPAFFPTNNTFYLMLPGADIQFGSPIAFKNVIYYDNASQRTLINLDTIFKNIDGQFRMGANVNLLGFGFKVKNMFFNFNTRLVNNINAGLSKSTIDALLQGNMDGNGNLIPRVELLNSDIINLTSYLESGLGFAYEIEPINLTVGVRAKLLFGVANMQTDNTKIVFNSTNDSLHANLYYEIQTSTCVPYDTNQKKFIFNMGDILSNRNTGVSFDIGAKYNFGPFTFSFSIIDLTAGIHWKNNVTTWRPSGGQGTITFNGMDVSTMLNGGNFNIDSLTTYLRNQFSDMTPTQDNAGEYWFSIPTKINLGASYSFAKILRAGLLFHGQFDRGLLSKSTLKSGSGADVSNTFRFNTTLSLGVNLYNWAEIIVGNSLVFDSKKADFFNPGAGLVFTPFTVFQLYFMADYISDFYLVESKAFNIRLGLNLLFGKGGRSVVTAE